MLQQAISLSLPILSFIFSILSVSTANPNVYVQCSQHNFTSTTPYESNVNSLYTSLVDSTSNDIFNKFEISPQNDGVYGLFQCRGDLTPPNCKDCVANAISQLKTICPMSTGGEIQLEGCFVKYDDSSFFGVEDKMEVCKKCGPLIGYNSDVLSRIDSALAYLVGGNSEYFRGGDFGSIQGVAQCVQDLSLSDCQDCLAEASGRLRSECETSAWGDMYLGKCYIRYANQGNLNPGNDNDNYPGNDNGNPTRNIRKGNGGKIVRAAVYSALAGLLLGSGLTIGFTCACKNSCNKIYNFGELRKLKKKAEASEKEAKAAKEKADKLQKSIDEEKKKCANYIPPKPCQPCGPPPCQPWGPPPCPSKRPPCSFGQPQCQSNSCFYL